MTLRALVVSIAVAAACGGKSDVARPPVIVVTVPSSVANGAAEDSLVVPIERTLAQLAGALGTRSVAHDGAAEVTVTVEKLDDAVTLDARARLDALKSQLPPGTYPTLQLYDADSPEDARIAVSSGPTGTKLDTSELADAMARRLELLDGVRAVKVLGGLRRTVEIQADPAQLAARDVTAGELVHALQTRQQIPCGTSRGCGAGKLVIAQRGDVEVRLEDVAKIAVTGVPSGPPSDPIAIAVWYQHGTDAASVKWKLESELEAARSTLPSGARLELGPPSPRSAFVAIVGPDRGEVERRADALIQVLGSGARRRWPVETALEIDRDRAATVQVPVAAIAQAMVASDRVVGVWEQDGSELDLRFAKLDLAQLTVRSLPGPVVALSSLVRRRTEAPYERVDRAPAVTLRIEPGSPAAAALEDALRALRTALPAGYKVVTR